MDCNRLITQISGWIKAQVAESNCRGVVVGLSGGLDSSVVLALAKHAVGSDALGVIMPCESCEEDEEHAKKAARACGAETVRLPLDDAYRSLLDALPPRNTMLARANVKARLRMTVLYYMANCRGYLVAGTGNRSELAVGYFTKYGDGGADILPIGGLLKTQVRQLARKLGVPDEIIEKPPSAGLWEGQTDEEEMGVDYRTLDTIIGAFDSGCRPDAPEDVVERVRSLMESAAHKLEMPRTFTLCD